jgi:hypothetical protein
MSDFPEGITIPEGAQELVDACKATWAVIQDEASTASDHDGAADRFEAAMAELAEMDVHVNNEGEYPVFSLGVKETACDSSVPVSGAKFLKLSEEVGLTTLTTVVDLSSYSPLKRCNLLVRHQAKGASAEAPSSLYKLCGRMGTHHTGGQNFCGVHKHSMRTHADGGKIYKIACRTSRLVVPSLGWQSHGPCQLRIPWYCGTLPRGWCHPRDADEHAIYSERQVERPGAKEYQNGRDPGSRGW